MESHLAAQFLLFWIVLPPLLEAGVIATLRLAEQAARMAGADRRRPAPRLTVVAAG